MPAIVSHILTFAILKESEHVLLLTQCFNPIKDPMSSSLLSTKTLSIKRCISYRRDSIVSNKLPGRKSLIFIMRGISDYPGVVCEYSDTVLTP